MSGLSLENETFCISCYNPELNPRLVNKKELAAEIGRAEGPDLVNALVAAVGMARWLVLHRSMATRSLEEVAGAIARREEVQLEELLPTDSVIAEAFFVLRGEAACTEMLRRAQTNYTNNPYLWGDGTTDLD